MARSLTEKNAEKNKGKRKSKETKGAREKGEIVSYLHFLFMQSTDVDLLDKVENKALRKRCGVRTVYLTFREDIRIGFIAKIACSFLVVQDVTV